MANFLYLPLCSPSDGKYVNLSNINAIAEGEKQHAKLFMAGGDIFETHCSFEEFMEILTSKGLLEEA